MIPLVYNSLPRFFGEGLDVSRLQRQLYRIMSSEDAVSDCKGMVNITIEI